MSQHFLRPYQELAVSEIRRHFAAGRRRVLLHLATGGGKTTVFSDIIKKVVAKGNSSYMVVRGRKLVDQGHKRLLREGVPHGVIMNGHWNKNLLARAQVCSIDTLISRKIIPTCDLLVIDEAHLFMSETCINFCNDYLAQNPKGRILAVTATPYVNGSMEHLGEVIVKPVAMTDLIADGFLVPPVYYAPSSIDTSNVRVSRMTDDYVTADLEEILNNDSIVGNLVENWKKYAENRRTLVFAVSIDHSKHIAQMYCDAGIKAVHCDADTPDDERERIIQRFEHGEIQVISNVGIFCTGVDIPSLGCVQFARPTQSYNLYIQMAGRGTRPCRNLYGPGRDKTDFIILDNAGNVLRHGFITNEPEAQLLGNKRSGGATILIKTCKACFYVYDRFAEKCPDCGAMNVPDVSGERMANEVNGELARIEDLPIEARAFQRLKELKKVRKDKQFKHGWVYYQMKQEFGDEIAEKYCPKRAVPEWLKR